MTYIFSSKYISCGLYHYHWKFTEKKSFKVLSITKQVTMEIAWSAVRPVRNRLLLGVFTFVHSLLVFSETWSNFPIMFTSFLNQKNCSAVHSESSVGGGGLYILPSDSHAPYLLERLAMERQRLQVEGFGSW